MDVYENVVTQNPTEKLIGSHNGVHVGIQVQDWIYNLEIYFLEAQIVEDELRIGIARIYVDLTKGNARDCVNKMFISWIHFKIHIATELGGFTICKKEVMARLWNYPWRPEMETFPQFKRRYINAIHELYVHEIMDFEYFFRAATRWFLYGIPCSKFHAYVHEKIPTLIINSLDYRMHKRAVDIIDKLLHECNMPDVRRRLTSRREWGYCRNCDEPFHEVLC